MDEEEDLWLSPLPSQFQHTQAYEEAKEDASVKGPSVRFRSRKRELAPEATEPKRGLPTRTERYQTEYRVTGRTGMESTGQNLPLDELIAQDGHFRNTSSPYEEEEDIRNRTHLFFNTRKSGYQGERSARLLRSSHRVSVEGKHQDVTPVFKNPGHSRKRRKKKPSVMPVFIVLFLVLCLESLALYMIRSNPEALDVLRQQLPSYQRMVEERKLRNTPALRKDAGKEETTGESPSQTETAMTLKESVETVAPLYIEQETETESVSDQSPVSLVFSGDIYLSSHVLNAYDAGGIQGVVSPQYLSILTNADYFVANEEFPFSLKGTAQDKTYTFRVPPDRVSLLKDMGLDLVTLANNHSLDFGSTALLDTLETLDQAGIRHIGAGKNLSDAEAPVTVSMHGKKIAFIGATRVIPDASWAASKTSAGVFSAYDSGKELQKEIKAIRNDVDYVIVYMHWGLERMTVPNDYQMELSHAAVDAGADLVIGAHPHVLQGIEYYRGVPVVYSLGNFVFGSQIPSTALLKVTLSGSKIDTTSGVDKGMTLELIPGKSGAGYTSALSDEAAIGQFYRNMEAISDEIPDSTGIKISSDGLIEPSI